MGFLDDVKRQQGKPADKQSAEPSNQHDGASSSEPAPGLQVVHDGLSAYTKRMNVALPNRVTDFSIREHGTLRNLRQNACHFNAETNGTINFGVDYKGSEPIQFETANRETCDELLDFLIGCGLKVSYRSHADWRFVFNVVPFVPVSITFQPIAGEAAVQFITRNLETLGQRSERVELFRLDEQFLVELKKCIQLEPNHFRALCGNEVPNDVRAQLKAKVAARQERRTAAEIASASEEKPRSLRSMISRWGGKK